MLGRYGAELRIDLRRQFHLDLNEWLRGERHWAEFFEFVDDLRPGSRYRAARLRDPRLIEKMAQAPDSHAVTKPRLEEFDSLRAELANIQDILWRIFYVSGHNDPRHAPSAPRPEMPWESRRSELHDLKSRAVLSVWMPWEVS